ncbi:putative ACR [Frankia sp. EI5c]|nr:putative ACR [Frankia sp. EI5c]
MEGRANEAALRALAEALGVRRADVQLIRSIGRVKFVEVDAAENMIMARLAELAQHSTLTARLDSR